MTGVGVKKIILFYFSGTGNTKWVCTQLKNELQSRGCELEMRAMENQAGIQDLISIDKKAMLGIAYPVHSFDAPALVYRFIRSLPRYENRKVFLIKCAADSLGNGGSTSPIRRLLRKQGYQVFYEILAIMPSNVFVSYPLHFQKRLFENILKKVPSWAEDLISVKTSLQRNGLMLRFISWISSLLEAGPGRRFFGKSLHAGPECNLCRVCVSTCPAQNISWTSNKPRWKWSCEFCMRCVYICPRKAILPRWGLKFLVLKEGYDLAHQLKKSKLQELQELSGYYQHFTKYLGNDALKNK